MKQDKVKSRFFKREEQRKKKQFDLFSGKSHLNEEQQQKKNWNSWAR